MWHSNVGVQVLQSVSYERDSFRSYPVSERLAGGYKFKRHAECCMCCNFSASSPYSIYYAVHVVREDEFKIHKRREYHVIACGRPRDDCTYFYHLHIITPKLLTVRLYWCGLAVRPLPRVIKTKLYTIYNTILCLRGTFWTKNKYSTTFIYICV